MNTTFLEIYKLFSWDLKLDEMENLKRIIDIKEIYEIVQTWLPQEIMDPKVLSTNISKSVEYILLKCE